MLICYNVLVTLYKFIYSRNLGLLVRDLLRNCFLWLLNQAKLYLLLMHVYILDLHVGMHMYICFELFFHVVMVVADGNLEAYIRFLYVFFIYMLHVDNLNVDLKCYFSFLFLQWYRWAILMSIYGLLFIILDKGS
jgi:hypothetical protein